MPDSTLKKSKELSAGKKMVFNGILVLLPVVIILLLEVSLRIGGYGYNLQLFQQSENYPGYFEINQDVNFRYFSKVGKTSPTNDIFSIEKPDSCYRIFVLGGSTTRGFPYQAGTSFPRILHYRLHDIYPNKQIEVVNLSASAINSYSYVDMIDEVLSNDPDLVLLYGGHNEYYGAMGVGSVEKGGNKRWMKKLHLKLIRTRTYQLLQNSIQNIASLSAKNENATTTLMARIVADKDIELGSDLYHKGVAQFEANIGEVIEKCQQKQIPIIISELVSNIEDQPPFKSVETDNGQLADAVYEKAKEAAEQGELKAAREFYYKAKDLDVVRFRAPEDFNTILGEFGNKEGVELVPMLRAFESASPDGLIGNELMLEHLHPTIDGYFLMADVFLKAIVEGQYVDDKFYRPGLKPSSYYRNNWGFSPLDSLIGDLNIKSLKSGWPFKMNAKPNAFLEAYSYQNSVDSMAYHYLIKTDRHIEDEHLKLADYYKQRGRYHQAFEEYYSMVKLHPYIPEMTYDAVLMLIELEKFAKAKEILEDAFFTDKSYSYYYYLGTLSLKTGNALEAVKYLEIAKEMQNENEGGIALLQPLFLAYRATGNTERGQTVLDEIASIDDGAAAALQAMPGRDQGLTQLIGEAAYLAQNQQFQKAIDLLLSASEYQDEFTVNKMLGAAYLMTKDFPASFKYCVAAYKINPGDADNIYNLFVLYLMQNKLELAKRMYAELEALNYSDEKLARLKSMYENKLKSLQNK